MKSINLLLFMFILCTGQGQILIPLNDEVIKVELKNNLVRIPVSSSATIQTLGDSYVLTKVDGELELNDLEAKLTSILKRLYEKNNECKESLFILDSDMFTENNKLFCSIEMRAQYVQCIRLVDDLRTSHRGIVKLQLIPFLTSSTIGVRAILIDQTMSHFLDYFNNQDTFILVEENLPKSYKEYDFNLLESTFFKKSNRIIWHLVMSGKLSGEEIGILIQRYAKNNPEKPSKD